MFTGLAIVLVGFVVVAGIIAIVGNVLYAMTEGD